MLMAASKETCVEPQKNHVMTTARNAKDLTAEWHVRNINPLAVISTITGIDARYLGMPSQGYQIGDYLVDREGTLSGPESPGLIEALASKGYEAK